MEPRRWSRMTGGPVGAVTGVGGVPLSDVAQLTNSEVGAARDISRAFDSAITKALSFPSSHASQTGVPNGVLAGDSKNTFLRDQGLDGPNTQVRTEKEQVADHQMEQVMEKFRGLYVEMTNFSVAWSVAKRTGRDVETLLRAQ
jgi:hypothetical protein